MATAPTITDPNAGDAPGSFNTDLMQQPDEQDATQTDANASLQDAPAAGSDTQPALPPGVVVPHFSFPVPTAPWVPAVQPVFLGQPSQQQIDRAVQAASVTANMYPGSQDDVQHAATQLNITPAVAASNPDAIRRWSAQQNMQQFVAVNPWMAEPMGDPNLAAPAQGDLGNMQQTISTFQRAAGLLQNSSAPYDNVNNALAAQADDLPLDDAQKAVAVAAINGVTQFAKHAAQAQVAAMSSQFVASLSDLSAASKLRTRSPGMHEKFINALAQRTGAHTLYVDGNTMHALLGQLYDNPTQLAIEHPGLLQKVADAVQTQSDVQIPVSKFTSQYVGTSLGKAMEQHLRLTPHQIHPQQAQAFQQAVQEVATRVHQAVSEHLAPDDGSEENRAALFPQQQAPAQNIENRRQRPSRQVQQHMSLSLRGLDFIKDLEKFASTVYDASGKKKLGDWTIGYGHKTTENATPVTEHEAELVLARDVQTAVDAVNRALKGPVTQNQFDALVSLAFNAGAGSVLAKNEMMRAVNSGKVSEDNFTAYRYSGRDKDGNPIFNRGLFRRRQDEYRMYSEGKY